MANDTDKILQAIKESSENQITRDEAIWSKLDEHSKEISSIKSDVRLGNWKIGALVASAAGFGWFLIKPALEKISKIIAS